MKHTELPFIGFGSNELRSGSTGDDCTKKIGVIYDGNDLRFIVIACNNHDVLLEGYKEARELMNSAVNIVGKDSINATLCHVFLSKAKAFINKSEAAIETAIAGAEL